MRWFPPASCFLWALSVLAAGCSSPTEEKHKDREFALTVFEGVQVPGVYQEAAMGTAEILSGDFTLSDDGSCGGRLSFRLTIFDEIHDTDYEPACTWTQEGDDLTLSWTHIQPSSGTLVGPHLTVIHRIGVVCVTMPCPKAQWTAEYLEQPTG